MHIHKLAPEMLYRVFLYSLPARDEMLRKEVKPINSISTPLNISHVCQRWRGVSLAFGDLWSHLFIKYTSCNRAGGGNNWSERALEIFTEWLQRTRGGLLNFTIHCHLALRDEDRSEHRAFENIIITLLSEQSRWQDADFWWDAVTVSSDFPGIHTTHMPCLVSLSLNHFLITPDRKRAISNVSIVSSRKLMFLDVSGCNNLGLRKGGEFLNFEAQYTEERLPVRTANLPSLKWFAYYGGESDYHNGRSVFSHFIRSTLPPLTVLDVAGYAAHEDTLMPALRLLNALEELRIKYWRLTPKFFRMLTPSKHWRQKSSSVVCPSLKKLYLIGVNDPDDAGSDSEGGDETEIEDEAEHEEEVEIVDEIDKEHGDDGHRNEVQNSEIPKHRPAPHVAFIGAFCAMVGWRYKFLKTLSHIWVYRSRNEGWIVLTSERINHDCGLIEILFRGCICVESVFHKPPLPDHLRRIATSLPD